MDIPPTDASLLLALRSQSPAHREAAWGLFEPRYRPVILAWCRQRVVRAEDAEGSAQDILLKLSDRFLHYCYDPDRGRFRGWLKAVVGNALTDYGRRQARQLDGDGVGGTEHGRMLAGLADPEAADQLSEAITEQPVTRAVQAIARVRARTQEAHWKAFSLHHVEGRTVAEVAAELGLGVANVYKILQRVKKQLEDEVRHE